MEQDLVLSRALVELFGRPAFAERAAFRGGTALHKLFFEPPGRYSEDIDLVQREPGPIGPLADDIREVLDPWLGAPRWKAGPGRFTLSYRFETTMAPVARVRLKLEINTREHFAVRGFATRSLQVDNSWFSGSADVTTYSLPELLGTKLRALYQRKKGRDLFDLALALEHPDFNGAHLIETFQEYMRFGDTPVSRAQFEANMAAKLVDPLFLADVPTLLRTGLTHDPRKAWDRVHGEIATRLHGEPWKGSPSFG
ncbi:MAG: nucleotidyl transferase AbiEii/AbiGii toxin family protein [Myxococcales bacterium]|nr:nucleotidyl transferase AbiEii/AbiGii toxin family protein [Myxococcales bacterium]